MKRVLLLPLLVLIPLLSNAQEKYFHDLKGMEDSEGVTQLFYRLYNSWQTPCSSSDGWNGTFNHFTNNIYHYDSESQQDSVKFKDYKHQSPSCDYAFYGVKNFIFTSPHPDSVIAAKFSLFGLGGAYYLENGLDNHLDLGYSNPSGFSFDRFSNKAVITTPILFLVPKARDDFEIIVKKSFSFTPNDTSLSQYSGYTELPDSMFIDFTVTGVSPLKSGMYVGYKDSSIVLSNDFGANFTKLVNRHSSFYDYDYSIRGTAFDADSSSFYILLDKTYLVKKESDTWSVKTMSHDSFSIDSDQSGHFYFSKKDSLFLSTDFGNTHQLVTTFPEKITGLYKKPNSEILYVLTTDELLIVENGNARTLKTLPVSNESEPTSLPNDITLFQNYPNPFNPSTVISFQLPVSSSVKLAVFDMLGRKIATLVDGKSPAGLQEVTFNAQGLSSGMYFYRLETSGSTLTKRLTIIK